jgi:hypothetical protein
MQDIAAKVEHPGVARRTADKTIRLCSIQARAGRFSSSITEL